MTLVSDAIAKKGKFVYTIDAVHHHQYLSHNMEMERMCAPGACTVEDESLDLCLKPQNLTDLNDDCKIKIFGYLECLDLINTAETCKQLKSSACDAFHRKYGNYEVELAPDGV